MSVTENVFYARRRSGSKLGTRIDADGKEVEVEVREDEEQKTKLQEIIDLLVAAGYFRARIKGLSAFDKVVGGMTWCIGTCNFDIDVDLLFQENLTIGQKISLTEKIVAVLPKMKCPHRIEPHQIQGLDFIHIFPVIQWLVKRSMETRQETGDFMRSYAISQFRKYYTPPEEQQFKAQQGHVIQNIQIIKEAYRPQRRFRRRDAPPNDEESRVQSTLLEYGYNFTIAVGTEGETGDVSTTTEMSPELQHTQKLEEGRLTAGVVGNLVNLQVQEITEAAGRYAELQAELEETGGGTLSSHARALSALHRQQAAMQEQEAKLTEEKARLEKAAEEATEKSHSTRASREKLEAALSDLEKLETDENQGVLRKLQALVVLNENLKQQEQEFREQCKQELSRLQSLVKVAQDTTSPEEDEDLVGQQLAEERSNVQRLRLGLAKRNRSIASLQRQLDEVPGRAELAQYQRRFLELYNQVAAKHKETKQFYTLYNTLDDTKLYLSKELSLLNSILDNYTE